MVDYKKAFQAVVSDPRYVDNLDWGEKREGHAEGTVRAHIAELELNLETLRPRLTNHEYWKLKLLIHTHDTFKAESQPGVPISDPRSHASLARVFLSDYCQDDDLLAMVQYHDEPFALYRQVETKGKYNRDRFDMMLKAIKDWSLFLAFNIIDGCTASKSVDPLRWFFGEVAGKVDSRFTANDTIPRYLTEDES